MPAPFCTLSVASCIELQPHGAVGQAEWPRCLPQHLQAKDLRRTMVGKV